MGRKLQSREPPERQQTLRQEILSNLREGALTSLELSGLLGIREKEVIPHLEHLQRSVRRSSLRFVVEPAQCLVCGYEFTTRARLSKPSACPKCRGQRIESPVFRLEEIGR